MDLHTSTARDAEPRVADDALEDDERTPQRARSSGDDVNRASSRSSSSTTIPDNDANNGPEKLDGKVDHNASAVANEVTTPHLAHPRDDVNASSRSLFSPAKPQRTPSPDDDATTTEQTDFPNNLVTFTSPTDPTNPKNFSPARKWALTTSMGLMTFVVTFSSSIFSVAVTPIMAELAVSRAVATLGVSLFLLGFVFGPCIFGPASEAYGRRVPLFVGYVLFGVFNVPVALGRDVATILVGRFLGGFFASAPLAIVGGALSDVWDPIPRAYAMVSSEKGCVGLAGDCLRHRLVSYMASRSLSFDACANSFGSKFTTSSGCWSDNRPRVSRCFVFSGLSASFPSVHPYTCFPGANEDSCIFAAGAFTGPVAGPIIGGFVTQSHLGWRWTAWITLIMTALFGVIGLFCIPETSAQAILTAKAKRLRSQTNNQALHSQMEENPLNARRLVTVYLVRPFVMLMHEPILSLLTAYMSFLYGVLYLLFAAYPIAFHEDRGWNIGVASLPFASFIVGIMMGTGVIAFSTRTNFTKSYLKHGKVVPEERLPPMVVGAVALPIGLFWFAWTSNPNITWVPQVLSSAVIGLGMLVTFWQGINYIIDCYGFYSNSAIAVNTFIRSIAGAAFPLFTYDMYKSLGVAWATSLLAFLCAAFAPVPILFYIYGARIRAKSRYKPA